MEKYLHKWSNTFTHKYIYIYKFYMHDRILLHTHTHTHTHTHIYIYIYIYIYILRERESGSKELFIWVYSKTTDLFFFKILLRFFCLVSLYQGPINREIARNSAPKLFQSYRLFVFRGNFFEVLSVFCIFCVSYLFFYSCVYYWWRHSRWPVKFGLVSLFNGIWTFVGYLMPKSFS